MKVSELSGALLDYWVARAEGCENPRLATRSGYAPSPEDPIGCRVEGGLGFAFLPSTSWAQGGPIIEREKLEIVPRHDMRNRFVHWSSQPQGIGHLTMEDASPLVAAMRAYVASKFGDEVPQEAQ